MSKLHRLSDPFRFDRPSTFRIRDVDPTDTRGLANRAEAESLLAEGVARLRDLQERLYAQDRWGVLLIFQAMDAAGKDGTIEHVMSGVNPQGCQVFSFKTPSAEELDHDFMWRTSKSLPERGRIGIFNRSYYEETLVVRVHPEFLAGQRLPASLVTKRIWDERLDDIAAFERYLSRNGFLILKFFLHVSADEQRERFLSRLDEPEKHWKFSAGDVRERQHRDAYLAAYEAVIRRTARSWAPWYVIPADHKWFTRAAVAAAIVEALDGLDLRFPDVTDAQRRELDAVRLELGGTPSGVALRGVEAGDDDDGWAINTRQGRKARSRKAERKKGGAV